MNKLTLSLAVILCAPLFSRSADAQTLSSSQVTALVSAETAINTDINALSKAVGSQSVHVIDKQNLAAISTLANKEENLFTLMQQDGLPPSMIATEFAVLTNWNALYEVVYRSGISDNAVRGQEVSLTMAYANLAVATSSLSIPSFATLLEDDTTAIGYLEWPRYL